MNVSISQVHLIVVFFIYGLAFFSMGLAMLLESGRSPLMGDGAGILLPLAVFGFLHGIHEWLEMVIQAGAWLGLALPAWLEVTRLILLVFSLSSLIVFGLRVLRPQPSYGLKDYWLGILLGLVYAIMLLVTSIYYRAGSEQWVSYADVLARYFLAVPGAFLAFIAFRQQAGQTAGAGRRTLSLYLFGVSWCFLFYSLTQIFVTPLYIFPAQFINSSVFTQWVGIPIQVVRAVLAVGIILGLMQAIHLAEEERQLQFLEMQQERLDALEQIRRDLIESENLRRQLLRHTVIAQEEERQRIARELHDETAQMLTAISLNLATLVGWAPDSTRVRPLIDRLQALISQMSDGIYRMVHDLRPAQLDDLGLAAALQFLVDAEMKNSGLQVTLNIQGVRQRLDPLVETVFFRVAQEALANIVRHAQVNTAVVELTYEGRQARLNICDQGVGFDVEADLLPPRGWGLAGMRERAESIGGDFMVRSMPGKGTEVSIVIPLAAPPEAPKRENNHE
jgi:signal transduction histidine kinase